MACGVNELATSRLRFKGVRGVRRSVMDRRGREYSLAELIADPLIGLVMKSDGVERRCIEVLFDRIARTRDLQVPNQRDFNRCLV